MRTHSGLRNGRQQRVVEYAKKTFACQGYYATSISQIVHEAGVSRGSFYQYFDNKLHLFQSILDSLLHELQSCIKPVALGPGAPPPLVQIQDNLTRVLNLVLRERDLTQILLHHTWTPDSTVGNRLEGFYGRVAEMIQRSLNLGVAMKLVRPCNTLVTAYSIIGAVKEVVLQVTSSKEPGPDVDQLVRELMDFGMEGILAKPRASLLGNTYGPRGLEPAHEPTVSR